MRATADEVLRELEDELSQLRLGVEGLRLTTDAFGVALEDLVGIVQKLRIVLTPAEAKETDS